VSDAFKFNFHEDEKAQYQPDYMAGAYSGGQTTSKGEDQDEEEAFMKAGYRGVIVA